ncbi:MAG: SpoIVB peptidase S55 domain-containing protein [Actinomycetota bacterium]
MRNSGSLDRRRGILGTAVVVFALLATTLAAAPAPAASSCSSQPAVFPEAQIRAGMTGTGLTTIEGTTPTRFDVEILGVMPDYIWLGIDVVVARMTGPQSFLDEVGGAFYGMSGSPVYIDGKLVGAVSYAVSGDPTIFGLTPAQAMVDMFNLSKAGAVRLPERIAFDPATRRTVARALGVPASQAPSGLQRIPTYLGVSGLSTGQLRRFQDVLDRNHAGMHVAPAAGMSAGLPVSSVPFAPGQPIGSVLSWGDATIWTAGTVTLTCGSKLIAYGHTLFGSPPGDVTIGMTGAEVLAVGSGGGIWPGDMVPVLTEPRGTFTQDRFAGSVGTVGTSPEVTPITSSFSSPDTGLSRDGKTEAIYQAGFWFPEIVWSHMIGNLGAVAQRIGDGTLSIAYTIEGLTAEGMPFTIENRTMVYSDYDAMYAAYKLVDAVYQLAYNKFEKVTFTGIHAAGEITQQQLRGTITRVRTASSLQPKLAQRSLLKVRPGDKITIETTLTPLDGGPNVITKMQMKVPSWAGGFETIMLRGGKERFVSPPRSFDELLAHLSGGEHPNDLIATGFGTQTSRAQDLVVKGKAFLTVQVVR